jgi:hypothetical protein
MATLPTSFRSISITPPLEDPDWFILEDTDKIPALEDLLIGSYVSAEVTRHANE